MGLEGKREGREDARQEFKMGGRDREIYTGNIHT